MKTYHPNAAEWRENISAALVFMQALPDEQVNLNSWITREKPANAPEHSCGTIACLGGWLPYIPHFEKLGVTSSWIGCPVLETASSAWAADEAAVRLFGHDAIDLFDMRGHNAVRVNESHGLSDRVVAVLRLQNLLDLTNEKYE